MFRKLANMEARVLRRQADKWEQHPYRTLLIAVTVQAIVQGAAYKARQQVEKSKEPKTVYVQSDSALNEEMRAALAKIFKVSNAPNN